MGTREPSVSYPTGVQHSAAGVGEREEGQEAERNSLKSSSSAEGKGESRGSFLEEETE